MAVTYMLTRDVDLAVQEEANYGTSPGAVAGTDMFKHTSRLHITPRREEYYRDKDSSTNNASVLSVQTGREGADVKIDCELIPSGDATTPTEPDVDLLIKAVLGTKHKATAHTTTRAGSTGTTLRLTAGGGAASGLAVGDMIAVDVSSTYGYEVRRITAAGSATSATADIGSGADGTVTTTVDTPGVGGNTWTIEVVEGVGLNVPMSAGLVGTDITVTLGTDGAGALDPTKNTATLVAAAITALAGVTAAASGTGASPLTAAEGPTTFAGGTVAGDNWTLNAAFSADPATGRTVKVGTTYKLLYSASLSLYVWQWIGTDGARHAVPGTVLQQLKLAIDFSQRAPVGSISFTGKGKKEITHATARPTPSTAGQPLLPAEGKLFISAALHRIVSADLTVSSLTDTRENESGSLEPTGVKNTNNGSRWLVEAMVKTLLTSGDRDIAALYNQVNATTPSQGDVIVQLGVAPGAIVAWHMPKWNGKATRSEQDGEFAVDLAGRAIGTTSDDEVFLAFI